MEERDPVTERFIGAAIEVHRVLGAGLLESIYEACVCQELKLRGNANRSQVPVPIVYKGTDLGCSVYMDLLVEDQVVVESRPSRSCFRFTKHNC